MNLTVIDERELLGKEFRIYGNWENPLFLARDVAEWIEHSKVSMMLDGVDEDEKLRETILTSGQRREMWFLTEDGLYEVLMQSRKPIAKAFKKEVKAILKQIRKTGSYMTELKGQEKMFQLLRNEVNEIVSLKIKEIEEKCSDYYRPTHFDKTNISSYIKKRLGITKANDEYELVKQRVLLKLGATKWEDIPVEELRESLNIIDESIRIVKLDRPIQQVSFF